MNANGKITQARLKELLNYDCATGVFTWRVAPCGRARIGSTAGNPSKQGYLTVCLDRNTYFCHRLAWLYVYGVMPPDYIDHIDGKKANNSICNLRLADRMINMQNQRKPHKNNKSGYLGVHFAKRHKKFVACIGVSGKKITIGYFDTGYAAYEAYVSAKRKFHAGGTL